MSALILWLVDVSNVISFQASLPVIQHFVILQCEFQKPAYSQALLLGRTEDTQRLTFHVAYQ